ncbi:DMT family transporter [Variovorax boronicumulans]|uniref:DMT family transporter n=1 Tax=Variovorax boronicumulans TaxID=436515 RepID=UPI00085C2A55|nr:DMT family transporter [Variovorax boronicumulans]OEZ30922.1 peptide ABC transporter ATP-binding protein [Variovorax boronicumulans]
MTAAVSVRNAGWLRAMPAVFVLIWSTGFIVARYGMPYAPPLKFLAVRYALSLACFGVWVVLARVAWPVKRAQWGHLAVTGVLMQAGYLGGVWAAVHAGMGAGLVALLVGIQPVLTAVWLSFNGGRISGRQWTGLALGFAGLVLVVSRKLGQGTEVNVLTMGLAVMALLSITAGTLYQKRFVAPCDVRSASAVQMAAALLVTLPFAALEAQAIEWNTHSIGAMAWSVLALSLGGSSLLYMLIQRGTATAVTSLLYLVPPCTALMAWLLFAEPITWTTVLGIGLTAVGVSLVVRAER